MPYKGESKKTMHNMCAVDTMEEVGRNMSRIYVALDNKQCEHQAHMIEIKVKLHN